MSEDHVKKAEQQIAKILSELERETGDLVENVEIVSADSTTMSDTRPQHECWIQITMQRIPGRRWACR